MFNVGGGEVLVILLIALIVLGPDKLPNAARQAGKYLGDFRRMSSGFQRELRDAMDLGDLGDIVSGKTKPQSDGGPTPQPAAADALAITPATDATPVDTAPAVTDAPSTNGSHGSTGSNGSSGVAAATGAATTNGAGSDPAVVRKRSIEVDGPSTSFD